MIQKLFGKKGRFTMKTKVVIPCLAALAIVVLGFSEVRGFNPATHIYITEHVYQYAWSVDLAYGSIAPDIDQYVADPSAWPTAYEDTHFNYSDLTAFSIGWTQRIFAIGWRSHGEKCGADLYAHFVDPFTGNDSEGGYVVLMAAELKKYLPDLPDEVAHFAIETAVDLLMQNNVDHGLGQKVLRASLFRSREDRNLLTRVLVLRDHRTDFLTLATAELTFRTLVAEYAAALSLPKPLNIAAVAALGAELSQELFGQAATKEELLGILSAAMDVCRTTYRPAVMDTISRIAADPTCH
jgi:hypothetical protein